MRILGENVLSAHEVPQNRFPMQRVVAPPRIQAAVGAEPPTLNGQRLCFVASECAVAGTPSRATRGAPFAGKGLHTQAPPVGKLPEPPLAD